MLFSRHLQKVRRPRQTDGDAACSMLGDTLITDPCQEVTRSIAVFAPARTVWPWLAQMMRGAGMYGWPRLESDSCRSADCLLRELPPPQVGDRLGDVLELVTLDAQSELVWRARPGVGVLDFTIDDLTLDYQVCALGRKRSRLLARVRASCHLLTMQVCTHMVDVIDFALPYHQLLRIKELAEADDGDEIVKSPGSAHIVQHQTVPFRPLGTNDNATAQRAPH